MAKLIYEIFERSEGNPYQEPDRLTSVYDITDDGEFHNTDNLKCGFIYDFYKERMTPDEFERWLRERKCRKEELERQRLEKCGTYIDVRRSYLMCDKPWEHYTKIAPYTNKLYPAAFFTLWDAGFLTFPYDTDEPKPAERFHVCDYGLVLNENAQRGIKTITVIKYHGEGEPWEPNPMWTQLPSGIVY